MVYFRSDYSLGAHPKVMDRLVETNMEHTDGYALDDFSYECADMIKKMIGKENDPNCEVHFMVGGTPTNTVTITAALRPYECVITTDAGHIFKHETGSIEANGHRCLVEVTEDGKMTVDAIEHAMLHYEDEHTVVPKVVYITHPTENGGLYTRKEFNDIVECCKKHDLMLYMDGARLGCALSWPGNDLTIQEIADKVDAFYIGGTKIGALFGEALIINNETINRDFRFMIKRSCTLLAKGRLIAIQLKALFEDPTGNYDFKNSLYYQLAKHENEMAIKIADGLKKKNIPLWLPHQTNQVFPILPNDKIAELEKDFFFYTWTPYDKEHSVIRLITNWNTTEEEVEKVIEAI